MAITNGLRTTKLETLLNKSTWCWQCKRNAHSYCKGFRMLSHGGGRVRCECPKNYLHTGAVKHKEEKQHD